MSGFQPCPGEPGPHRGHRAATSVPARPCGGTHLEAVVLAQDAAVHRLDDHLLLHAEVQRLYRAAGAEQGLVRARLLQPGHQMGPGGGRFPGQAQPAAPLPSPSPGGLSRPPSREAATPPSKGALQRWSPSHLAGPLPHGAGSGGVAQPKRADAGGSGHHSGAECQHRVHGTAGSWPWRPTGPKRPSLPLSLALVSLQDQSSHPFV